MQQVTSTEKIRFLRGVFKDIAVSRDGNDVAVSCPNCKQKDKKKLSISIDTWKFHCWVCGVKGTNLKTLFRQFHSPEVAIAFAQKFGFKDEFSTNQIEEEKVELPENLRHVVEIKESKNPDHRICYKYLLKRGLTERDMWFWKICVSDEAKFSRRVIIPSFDADGDLNYFVSRSVDDNTRPRYLNAKANKTEIIFSDLMVDWSQPITLVEGAFDAIKIGQNAIPILGSYLPVKSALFSKIVANNSTVLLALDPDVIDKTHRISANLYSFGISVYHVDVSGFKDVGEMPSNVVHERIKAARPWAPNMGMMHKISKISSGSIL